MRRFKIERHDKYNLVLSEWKASEVISKGRYQGEMSQEKWQQVGFFSTLEVAARGVGRLLIEDSILSGKEIQEAIQTVLTEVTKIVRQFMDEQCAVSSYE